jgi:hypothetical protein
MENVTRDLFTLEDLRPGSLLTQYNVCGTSGCRGQSLRLKSMAYYDVGYTCRAGAASISSSRRI